MESRRKWITIIVTVLILVVLGIYFFSQPFSSTDTLALETKIREKKSIILVDKTIVHLNENSQLFYTSDFNGDSRNVTLFGEGYFDIVKKEEQPFIITTAATRVESLGAILNIKAYPQEAVTDILVAEGKVTFTSKISEKSVFLIAKQLGVFSAKNNEMTKTINTTSNAYAWKSGVLTYKETPLVEVFKDFKRLFKVDVDLQNESLKTCPVSEHFPNAEPEAILEYLAIYFKMKLVKINAAKYRLHDGICQ